jgi:hypothetical protein
VTPSDRIKAVLLRVRELTANATPGPWSVAEDWYDGPLVDVSAGGEILCGFGRLEEKNNVNDAAWVAESRTLLPRLAEALETMLNAVTERHRFMPSYEDPEYVGADGSHTVPAWCKDCGADWPCHYGLAVESVSALVSPGDSVEGE